MYKKFKFLGKKIKLPPCLMHNPFFVYLNSIIKLSVPLKKKKKKKGLWAMIY